MSYLKERVAYLKGLAEGMRLSDETNEGRMLKAIVEVLDDVAITVEDLEDVQEELSEQMDDIDEDLAQLESEVYEDEEDEEDSIVDIECPHCNKDVEIDLDDLGEDSTIECPNCHEKIEVELDCDCDCCEDEE